MEIIIGILLALVSGYAIYLRAEVSTREENITKLSEEIKIVLSEKLKIKLDSTLIQGVLNSFLLHTSKAVAKKANKSLEDFVVVLEDGEYKKKFTADIIETDGTFEATATEIIDEVE